MNAVIVDMSAREMGNLGVDHSRNGRCYNNVTRTTPASSTIAR